jgi:uncharacterized protein YlzI (FlbEa/FlbD family)
MRPEFVMFTDVNGQQVAVNPAHVRCVRSGMDGSTTIEFDQGHYVMVKDGIIDVTRGLRTGQE